MERMGVITAVTGGVGEEAGIYNRHTGFRLREHRNDACRALVSRCQNFKCSRQGRRRPPANNHESLVE